MKITASIFLIFFFSQFGIAQEKIQLAPGSGDCENAIFLKDTVFGPTSSPIGHGNMLEISGNDPKSLHFFKQENNTVWYQFQSPYSTLLSLDIIPENPKEDLDFLLFRADAKNYCEKIRNKEVTPVRTNISRVKPEIDGKTGLSEKAVKEYVHSGPGDAFSKSIEVTKGAVFYLVIDHYETLGDGHRLHLRYKDVPKKVVPIPVETKKEEKPKIVFYLDIFDADNGDSLLADVEMADSKKSAVQKNNVRHFSTLLDQYRSYSLNVSRKNYMYFTKKIITSANTDTIFERAELQPIKKGEKISIQDISFKGDAAEILPSSTEALEILTRFLRENEDISIEIQGHVNAPGKKNKKRAKALSQARAEAVYNYLILNDVDAERLKHKGFGNTKMIYPEPIDVGQAQMNRRVEVKITAK